MGSQVWNLILNDDTNLHHRIYKENVITLDLDLNSLEQGLFEVSEDYKTLSLWETAATTAIPPEDSVRLVSFRYFDICYETDLCDGFICIWLFL